jgi:hypothetical protein
MMGLYPSSTMNNLDAWEQNNAVPPIDADYSQWQEELGAYALPYGFNTFPMYQKGIGADYMLAVCDENCPLFKSLWDEQTTTIDAQWKVTADSAPIDLSNILTNNTVEEACDYARWAYISYIDLSSQAEFDYLRTEICPGFYSDMNNAQKSIDEDNYNIVSVAYI